MKTGRSYISGKALSEGIRRGIIVAIVQNGKDHISGFFKGSNSDFFSDRFMNRWFKSKVQILWSHDNTFAVPRFAKH